MTTAVQLRGARFTCGAVIPMGNGVWETPWIGAFLCVSQVSQATSPQFISISFAVRCLSTAPCTGGVAVSLMSSPKHTPRS